MVNLYRGDGTIKAHYEYDSWGRVLSVTDGNGNPITAKDNIGHVNPIRYRGYYYDTETGLYYLKSRYYDPELGRFVNADSQVSGLGGDIRGLNLFAYCFNSPITLSDADGNWPKWLNNVLNAVVNTVIKVVAVSAARSAASSNKGLTTNVKASANSLPKKGKPGSSQTLPNPDGTPKQKRWYGPDGDPERDRDYNHPGNMPFPHDHGWENGVRGKDHLPPDPSYKMNWEPVIGIGLITICSVCVIAIAADDATGVGVADDFLLGPLGAGIGEGWMMIFG